MTESLKSGTESVRGPAFGYMVASAFFFSLMSVQVKVLGRLPIAEIILARSVVSLILTVGGLRRLGISPWGKARGRLLLRGLFGFLGLCCFFGAIHRLDLSDATVLHYLNPILTAVFAAVALGERIRRLHLLALLCSFSGVVLVARPAFLFGTASLSTVGLGLGIGGAVFSALAYTMIRSLRTESPLVVVFYFPLVTLPLAIPWAAYDFVMPSGWEWLLLLGIGVTTQLAQIALTRGLSVCPAGPAMNVAYSQVLFAVVLQALVFGVVPHALGLAGGAMIFAGVALISLTRR